MSVKVMAEVFAHSQATLGARLVLLAIADCVDEETRTGWPSVPLLARKARLDARNVQRALKRLVQLEELRVEGRPFQSNLYVVLPLPGDASATPGELPPPAERHHPPGASATPLVAPAPPEPSGNRQRTVRVYKPKTPWPENFTLTDDLRRYAERNGLDADYQFQKFKTRCARDGAKYVDWPAAFQYWVRNAWEFSQGRATR